MGRFGVVTCTRFLTLSAVRGRALKPLGVRMYQHSTCAALYHPTAMSVYTFATEHSRAKTTVINDPLHRTIGTAGSGRKGRSTGRACGGGATGEQGSCFVCTAGERPPQTQPKRQRIVPTGHRREKEYHAMLKAPLNALQPLRS